MPSDEDAPDDGASLWETLADLEGTDAEAALRSSCGDQETVTCEATLPSHGRSLVFQTYPDDSGLSVFVDDVTDDRRREAELEERSAGSWSSPRSSSARSSRSTPARPAPSAERRQTPNPPPIPPPRPSPPAHA